MADNANNIWGRQARDRAIAEQRQYQAEKRAQATHPLDRTKRENWPGPSEIATNLASNWVPELKDTARSLWETVRYPGSAIKGAGEAWLTATMFEDGRQHAATGQWPQGFASVVLTPAERQVYQQLADRMYHGVAQKYSYIDPNTGQRQYDYPAMTRDVSKDPVGVGAAFLTFGESGAASAASMASKMTKAAETAGSFRAATLARGAASTLKGAQTAFKVGANAANPIPLAVATATKMTAPLVRGAVGFARGATLYGEDGNLTKQGAAAFKKAKLDPEQYQDPTSVNIFKQTVAQDGLIPQSLKKAAVRTATIPENASSTDIANAMKISPTRSMIEGTQMPSGGAGNPSRQAQKDLSDLVSLQKAGLQQTSTDIGAPIRRSLGQNPAYTTDPVPTHVVENLRDNINASLFEQGMPTLEYMAAHPNMYPDVSTMLNKNAGLRSLNRWEIGAEPMAFTPDVITPDAPVSVNTPMGKYTLVGREWYGSKGPVPASQKEFIDSLNAEAARIPRPAPPPPPPPPAVMPTAREILDTFHPGKGEGSDSGVAYHIRNAVEDYLQRRLPSDTGADEAIDAHRTARNAFAYGFGNEVPPHADLKTRHEQLAKAEEIIGAPNESQIQSQDEPNAAELNPLQRIAIRAAGAAAAGAHPWLASSGTHLMERIVAPKTVGSELNPKFPTVDYTGMGPGATAALRLQESAALIPSPQQYDEKQSVAAPVAAPPTVVQPPQAVAPMADPYQDKGPVAASLPDQPYNPTYDEIFGKPANPQNVLRKPIPKNDDNYHPTAENIFGKPPPANQEDGLTGSVTDTGDYTPYTPQSTGGRTTYKAGGQVKAKDIEPLVQALLTKAKKAKKVSNKATEPLLNSSDSAIASALAVAQKAI